ncbi:MAG: primase-helicase zinc-binding domain-containing protein [Deltaproteobacteria bacterium]
MNIVDVQIQDGGNPVHASKGEWHDACPDCGGVDRFSSYPDRQNSNGRYMGGRFCCRGCSWSGDAVNYLMKRRALSFRDACKYLEVEPGIMPDRATRRSWTPAPAKALPVALWQSKANAFVVTCSERLERNTDALSWLQSERGLNPETVKASKLGWNARDVYQSRESWGLPPGKKLWLPKGLTIPNYTGDAVTRIRIRRSEPPAKGSRYIVASGSYMGPMVHWQDQDAVCVVESELDGLLVHQECSDIVGVVSLGSAALKPDSELHERLMNAKTVLCSLDADAAGVKAVGFWRRYAGFKRWPVIRGKDICEQMRAGVPVRVWVQAGLI